MEQYLFGSARTRVLENGLVGREKLDRLLAASGVDRCVDMLSEFGVPVVRDEQTGRFLREETLLRRLESAYDEVSKSTENAPFTRVFRWQYDCNNLKAMIKCHKRGIDPSDMLFDFGNIALTDLSACVKKNDFSTLEEPFCSAAVEAVDTFSKSGNPQWVDLILDRACYTAMLKDAASAGTEFLSNLVRLKIDIINVLTCVRLLRMNSGENGKLLLRDAFIEGGTIELSLLSKAYENGEEAMWKEISRTGLEAISGKVSASSTLTDLELTADNAWMAELRKAKMIPYGVEPMVAYLAATEYEVRNLRIVLAGIEAGLQPKTIGERIRMSYV